MRDHDRWARSDQGTGTDLFARRFNDAGFTVLAFDFRRLGESGGQPRQVVRIREQLADWQAPIDCASALPGVDASTGPAVTRPRYGVRCWSWSAIKTGQHSPGPPSAPPGGHRTQNWAA